MKILFVEDQISQNPSIIRTLFSSHLGKTQVERLKEIEIDEYDMGPGQIKTILEETGVVDFEYNFPDALGKVINQQENYALFIVDRNLFSSNYEFEDVKKVDPSFPESFFEEFKEREGDYLLTKLFQKNVDLKERFYFFTANTDELRGDQKNRTYLLEIFPNFKAENFIEKGNVKDFNLKKLIKLIEDFPGFNLRYKNKYYLSILKQQIGEETSERFFQILKDKDNMGKIEGNLSALRKIYEDILDYCPRLLPDMAQCCIDQRTKNVIKDGNTIKWLFKTRQDDPILNNFLFSIRKITNKFGAHTNKNPQIFKPTTDTVNSLVYAMKDFIRWFGKLASTD